MSDVFLSYAREDEPRVAPIVEGLRAAGLSVWWDHDLGGGDAWRQRLADEIAAAKCVLVVWSATSVGPAGEFVQEEAGRGKARGVLLPVRLDRVPVPLGFGQVQALNLIGWRGNRRARRFRLLVASVQAMVSGGPRPRVRALSDRARRIAALLSVAGALSALIGFASDLSGVQALACKVPGLNAVCARWGFGGVPTREEEALWKDRRPGDCQGLRAYLERFPQGAYAEEAGRRLQAAKSHREESWGEPAESRLPLTVRSNAEKEFASEEAARKDALERGKLDAASTCEGYEVDVFRLLSAEAKVERWRCYRKPPGFACGFDGKALCRVQARRVETWQVCP